MHFSTSERHISLPPEIYLQYSIITKFTVRIKSRSKSSVKQKQTSSNFFGTTQLWYQTFSAKVMIECFIFTTFWHVICSVSISICLRFSWTEVALTFWQIDNRVQRKVLQHVYYFIARRMLTDLLLNCNTVICTCNSFIMYFINTNIKQLSMILHSVLEIFRSVPYLASSIFHTKSVFCSFFHFIPLHALSITIASLLLTA